MPDERNAVWGGERRETSKSPATVSIEEYPRN